MYVPVVPPPTPSRRARDLGEHLASLIDEYERQYPDTSPLDVRQALHMAARRSRGNSPAPMALAVVLGVVMMVLLMGFFVFARGSEGVNAPFPIIAVLIGVGLVGGLFAVIVALKR